MGRHRSRSYSPRRRGRSRSPPYTRGKHYDDPRDRRLIDHRRRSPPPSGLLVRNIPLDTRPEELRIPFENFGPVKDVYLPRDYHTGEPRGFGFVKFRYPEDAAKAKDKLNYTDIGGREIRIVYAEENRKTPREMRKPGHTSGRYEGRRRTPVRSPSRRYHSCSRSPVTKRRDSRSVSRSPSRHVKKDRSRSPSGKQDRSPSPRSEQERSKSPRDERDYKRNRSMSPRKKSPYGKERKRNRSSSPLSEQERSQTPRDERDYKRNRSTSPRKKSPYEKERKRGVRSPSPRDTESRDEKQYKLSERSHSPRQKSFPDKDDQASKKSRVVSPRDEVLRSPRDSVSPRDEDFQPPRRSSKRSRDISPHDEKIVRAKRSLSPYDEGCQSSKRSNDISPRDEKLLRSSKRSVSPQKESPLTNESPDGREHQHGVRSPNNPRNIKSHDISGKTDSRDMSFSNGNDFRSSGRSVSPSEV